MALKAPALTEEAHVPHRMEMGMAVALHLWTEIECVKLAVRAAELHMVAGPAIAATVLHAAAVNKQH